MVEKDLFDKDFDKFTNAVKKLPSVSTEFSKYYLLGNPFPYYNIPQSDIFVNFDDIKQQLFQRLAAFSADPEHSQTALVQGAHGAGKTNLLKYFHALILELNKKQIVDRIFPVIYILDPGDVFLNLYKACILQISEAFLESLCDRIRAKCGSIPSNPREFFLSDFNVDNREMANALVSCIATGLAEPDQPIRRRILERWLSGDRLAIADLKRLHVDMNITTSSTAIRYLCDLISLMRATELCRGLVILIDEFELVFSGRQPKSQVIRFTEDVRHFVELLGKGVFLIFAAVELFPVGRDYPALSRRLGADQPLQLNPLNEAMALQFAREFISYGRSQFANNQKLSKEKVDSELADPYKPLAEEQVKHIFQEVRTKHGEVYPGYFLPRLHEEVEKVCLA